MRISVAMTTYNGERFLEQQIDSILAQTLVPVEIIVCDDCSTDGTINILERYRQEGLLRYAVNDRQLGLIENFKKVVAMVAEGNYIALSDQDDFWLPDKLEKSAELLRQIEQIEEPCMVYTDLLLVDEQEKVLNKSFRNELGQDVYVHNLQTLVFGNFINGCTVLMNPVMGTYFPHIPAGVRLNHDGWIGLVAFTFGRTEGLKEPLVRYKKHGSNVSIAADTKSKNRYRSTFEQLMTALKGKDDFLSAQFETVSRFYQYYSLVMNKDQKLPFERFLRLENKTYLQKKIAFAKIIRDFRL